TLLQPGATHDLKHVLGFRDITAEWHHGFDVSEAEFITGFFEGLTFQLKGRSIFLRVVPARTAPTNHRVVLFWLELRTADQIGVFVGLKITEADDDIIRIK